MEIAAERGLEASIENENELVFKNVNEVDEVALGKSGIIQHPCYDECFDDDTCADCGESLE